MNDVSSTIERNVAMARGADRATLIWWIEASGLKSTELSRRTGIPYHRIITLPLKGRDAEIIGTAIDALRPLPIEGEWRIEYEKMKTSVMMFRAVNPAVLEEGTLHESFLALEAALSPLGPRFTAAEVQAVADDSPLRRDCIKCEFTWHKRRDTEPRRCPRCFSPYWAGTK